MILRVASQAMRAQRRGMAYVAVLDVALLVTVIGLSALLTVRVENRGADLVAAAVKADVYAQSLVDLTLNNLCNDPNWRTTYTSGVWTASQTVGDVICSTKLVDELDGILAGDANQPARLYAKATVGDAVRIYSVRIDPQVPPNLLNNGDIEAGTQYWTGYNSSVEARTDDVHGGAQSLYVGAATGLGTSGAALNITNAIKNGASYTVTLWLKAPLTTVPVRPRIEVTSSTGGTQSFNGGVVTLGATWTKVTQTLTPSWTGTLTSASLSVVRVLTTGALRLDDATLTEQGTLPPLTISPGSWRRELVP